MKYMQTGMRKYLVTFLGVAMVCFSIHAQPNAYLEKADELYKKKQFTQSFELYEQLFKQGKSSPAMLLKMAYIQEGLGHISKTLYYLTLYYKETRDERVLAKIDEIASNNSLQGYEVTPAMKFFGFVEDHFLMIAGVLVAAISFLFALIFYRKRRRQQIATLLAMACLFAGVLFIHINFSESPRKAITADTNTYLMSGPSAGASLIAIIPDGHELSVSGKKDVWLKVHWLTDEAWLRESSTYNPNF